MAAAGVAGVSAPLHASTTRTGNSALNNVVNDIDETLGAWVITRNRNSALYPCISQDTVLGIKSRMSLDSTALPVSGDLSAFNPNGHSFNGVSGEVNLSANAYVDWVFRKAVGFFDVFGYAGDGTTNKKVPHQLGEVPGMIVVKKKAPTVSNSDWYVYINDLGASSYIILSKTAASVVSSGIWGATLPTDQEFTVGSAASNAAGSDYNAYLFASNPNTSDKIRVGSTVGGPAEVYIGWKAAFLLYKRVDGTGSWGVLDAARPGRYLPWNSAAAESAATAVITDTGIILNFTGTYMYMVIR